jgi:hypothetical protein
MSKARGPVNAWVPGRPEQARAGPSGVSFPELVKMMVDADIAELRRKLKGGREAIWIRCSRPCRRTPPDPLAAGPFGL